MGVDLSANDALAARQIAELAALGVTHVIDVRMEGSDEDIFADHLPHVN